MQKCDEFLSELPENFDELDVDEAVDLLAANHAIDATRYFQCKRKQEETTRWIERNP